METEYIFWDQRGGKKEIARLELSEFPPLGYKLEVDDNIYFVCEVEYRHKTPGYIPPSNTIFIGVLPERVDNVKSMENYKRFIENLKNAGRAIIYLGQGDCECGFSDDFDTIIIS